MCKLQSCIVLMPFFLITPASCQNQKTTTLVVNLATFWCINFKNKQTNKTPLVLSTPILWQQCQSRLTPTSSAAPLLCILFHACTLLPRTPTPPLPLSLSVGTAHFLSSLIISIHPSLVGASQRGSGCCVQGILGLWRQFGNEARLHLNTVLSGHLVNLMRGG